MSWAVTHGRGGRPLGCPAVLFLLIRQFRDALDSVGLGFTRVLLFPTFQAAACCLLAFGLCLVFGPRVIAWLGRQKIGDHPEFDQADVNALMAAKAGTPTMGGLLIVGSIVLTTLLLADLSNFYVQMALVLTLLLGALGGTDDWLKLTAQRRDGSRTGLTGREKLVAQVGLGLLIGTFTWRYGQDVPEVRRLYVPFLKDVALPLTWWVFVPLTTLVIVATSNAVNLTDGLDGLASGTTAITSFALLVLALIVGDAATADALLFHHIFAAGQAAALAGAAAGACLGFLWFNCPPARVFMGDTGSLALGGLVGYLAVVLRQELLLLLIGGIFVAEAGSVLIQRYTFKLTRYFTGNPRRVFLMAPLHHHFQRKGWSETQVVVRFWLIAAMLAALAVATVKLR